MIQLIYRISLLLSSFLCLSIAQAAPFKSSTALYLAMMPNAERQAFDILKNKIPSSEGNSLFRSFQAYYEQDYKNNFEQNPQNAIGIKVDFYPLTDYFHQKQASRIAIEYSHLKVRLERARQQYEVYELIVDTESVLSRKKVLERFGKFLESSRAAVDEYVEKGNGSPKSMIKVHNLFSKYELEQIRTTRDLTQLRSRLENNGVKLADIDSLELISEEKILDVLWTNEARFQKSIAQRLLALESDLKLEASRSKSSADKQWLKGLDLKATRSKDRVTDYTLQLTFNIPAFAGGSPSDISKVVSEGLDSIQQRREFRRGVGLSNADYQEVQKLLEILQTHKNRRKITSKILSRISNKVVSNDLELFLEIQNSAFESEVNYIELRQEVIKKYLTLLLECGVLSDQLNTNFLSSNLEKF